MSSSPRLGIVIADKNTLMLRGLSDLICQDERYEIRATATDGELFMKLVERIRFDIGIIGWKMPYNNGRQVLTLLRERESSVKIIVYSGADVGNQVQSLGGAGFYSKAKSPEGLLDVVLQVGLGNSVFPYDSRKNATDSRFSSLSTRELQILEFLIKGNSNRQIAKHFKISINTVKFHLKNLYEKAQIDNRTQAVAFYNQFYHEDI